MPEFLQEFLSWYLAPWRRIGRKEFGVALTIATIPGIVFMVMGWGNSAGSFVAPLMDLSSMSQPVGNMELESNANDRKVGGAALKDMGYAPEVKNPLAAPKPGAAPVMPAAPGFDWSGLINGLILLAMVPLGRMRLRDMGWFGWQENVLTVAFNISVVEGLIQSLSGHDILPFGTLWGILNFVGYGWLTFAKSKARLAVHEKVPDVWQAPDVNANNVRKKDDDYDY